MAEAIATGGPIASLLAAVQIRQTRRDELVAAIAATEAANYTRIDRRAIARHVRGKLAEWRGLLTDSVEDGRTLLRQVLTGPLRFTPEDGRYEFEGEAAMGRLLSGMAGVQNRMASPPGFEPGFQP